MPCAPIRLDKYTLATFICNNINLLRNISIKTFFFIFCLIFVHQIKSLDQTQLWGLVAHMMAIMEYTSKKLWSLKRFRVKSFLRQDIEQLSKTRTYDTSQKMRILHSINISVATQVYQCMYVGACQRTSSLNLIRRKFLVGIFYTCRNKKFQVAIVHDQSFDLRHDSSLVYNL